MSDLYNEDGTDEAESKNSADLEEANKSTEYMEVMDSEESGDSDVLGKESTDLTKGHKDASKTANAGKSDNSEYEDVCFICRRPESKAGRMFKLPNNICVCDDCMHKTMDTVSQFDYQGMLNNPNLQSDLDMFSKQNGFPNISFVNLADLQGDGGIPNKQKLKKKKKKRAQSLFWISRIFLRRIKSRRVWMSMW